MRTQNWLNYVGTKSLDQPIISSSGRSGPVHSSLVYLYVVL